MAGYFKDFTTAYSVALLWASTDDNGEALDATFGIHDFSAATRLLVEENCIAFIVAAHAHGINLLETTAIAEQAGHDFWLTRNGHGTGFWDRPEVYGKEASQQLTELAETFREQSPYVSDTATIEIA